MTLGSVEPIPEGFLARLLQEFGLQWTHLVILSGVGFSSFHLEGYLNPGVWILGTVASFGVVYLFRDQISPDFPRVALLGTAAVLLATSIPLAVLVGPGSQHIGSFLKRWSEAATLYLAAAIGIPLGVMILSYRARDEFLRSPLPPALAKAVNESVAQSDFVHDRVDYTIDLIPSGDARVIMRYDVTMNLINRAKRRTVYRDIFDPAGDDKHFHYAAINGDEVDHDDPERISERGLLLEYEAQPSEHFQVMVTGQSTFYRRDSELVGAYLPCTSLSILIRKPPDDLRVSVQSLLRRKVDPKHLATGDLLFEYADGILPFQGTRIYWEPRDELTSDLSGR